MASPPSTGGYAGVEFFGSSQITKSELEKELGLKPGADATKVDKAVTRLRSKLAARGIKANIDTTGDETGREFVTVDVLETGVTGVPVRKLTFLRHINLSSEVPFQTLSELFARREQLAAEGRSVTESYDAEGNKLFSDEPCNQFAEKLKRQVPSMRGELFSVLASDPEAIRRTKAIEVLNWGANVVDTCAQLIPAIDDSSEAVRSSAARFIYPRLGMLPTDFPYTDLVEAFSHQLNRPSHMDRFLALRCLAKLGQTHPQQLYAIKEFDEDRLKQLQQTSVVSGITKPAGELVTMCEHLPPRPKAPRSVPMTEF